MQEEVIEVIHKANILPNPIEFKNSKNLSKEEINQEESCKNNFLVVSRYLVKNINQELHLRNSFLISIFLNLNQRLFIMIK